MNQDTPTPSAAAPDGAGDPPAGQAPSGVFVRPQLRHAQPRRGPSGLYRDSPPPGSGSAGGVPLNSAEAVVIAAVRKGYRVAEAQVDRSARWAKRLRNAGDQAVGSGSERTAVDAAERLVFKSMMSGLAWLEALASDSDSSPLRRFASAEYRLLGSLLGLQTERHDMRPRAGSAPAAPAGSADPRPAASDPGSQGTRLQVFLDGDHQRAVRVVHWDVQGRPGEKLPELTFYAAADAKAAAFKGSLTLTRPGQGVLRLTVPRRAPAGVWRAAVCSDQREQRGIVEISI